MLITSYLYLHCNWSDARGNITGLNDMVVVGGLYPDICSLYSPFKCQQVADDNAVRFSRSLPYNHCTVLLNIPDTRGYYKHTTLFCMSHTKSTTSVAE